jgi:glutaminase
VDQSRGGIFRCALAGCALAGCALALALLPTACATPTGTASPAIGAGSVAYTPALEEQPTGFVLAAQTTAAPAPQPAPRPAPPGDPYRDALADAYKAFKGLDDGKNADYIPVLAKVDSKLYGLALVTVQGAIYEIGSARQEFSIQSVEKPFTLARAIESVGADTVNERIGVNATGMRFNSILAIDLQKNIPSNKDHVIPAGNPLVNAGAITTVDLLPAGQGLDRWGTILANLEAFAGRALKVDDEVYKSETETNTHNQAIVQLLKDYEVIKGDPMQALDLYTRACAVSVSARDLAVMGATLANGGRNPVSGEQVVAAPTAAKVLAVVSTAGMYETSGEWLYRVGVPAKSGVGGGIVAVVPGRFAVGTFAPPLDQAGNSVRGQHAIEAVMKKLGGSLFASKPVPAAHRTGAAAPAPAAAPVAKGTAAAPTTPPVARGN